MKIILSFLIMIGFINPILGAAKVIKSTASESKDSGSAEASSSGPVGNCSGCNHC